MSGRVIDAGLLADMSSPNWAPVVLASLTFRTGTQYVWSGVGSLSWNGWTFTGVGDLGKVGEITECAETMAKGTTVELSGLNPAELQNAMQEIRQGAPARLWLSSLQPDGTIRQPCLLFRGQIDKAPVEVSATARTITLNLEEKYINHGRPNARRYTSADQRANGYPDDSGFDYQPALIDQALFWA